MWYYCANWIGIDGDGSGDVCQMGIECNVYRSGTCSTRTTYGASSGRWSRRPGSFRKSGHPARCDSFVSLLSAAGVALEDIARLGGHIGTTVTEAVYRKQIRPVIEQGATAMNRIFSTAR